MSPSPILVIHIVSGTLGFLSGAVALFLRKGSRWHALIGGVFVVTMVTLTLTGIEMAIVKSQPGNILGGAVTFYLVATAWMTARRRAFTLGWMDWVAVSFAAILSAIEATLGIEALRSSTGMIYDYSAGPYFFLGTVAVISMLGDVRLMVRRTQTSRQRMSRHLWRMCFALFIAAASIFLSRSQLFPLFMRRSGMLYALTFFPLILMFFWLLRLRFAKTFDVGMQLSQKEKLSVSV